MVSLVLFCENSGADLPNVSSRWTWTAHRARLNRVQRLNQYHRQDLTTRQD